MNGLNRGFVVGEWTVYPTLNQLSGPSGEVTVEPQTMALLVLLAENHGEVVTTEAIVHAIWGGRPISDNPVYKTVGKLRQALGDSPRDSSYVATITKARLPFALEARARGGGPNPRRRLRRPARRTDRRIGRLIPWLGVVALAALAFWWAQRPSPADESVSIRQLVTLPGASWDPSFSPDGNRLVFVNDNAGVTNLWLLDLESGQPTQLTDHPSADTAPAFAPEGERIAFVRDGDIWLIDSDGAAQRLIEHGTEPAWSGNGRRLVFERDAQVWIARADGRSQARVNTIVDQELLFVQRKPAFSPDGRSLVYFEAQDGPLGDLWRVDLLRGTSEQLTFDHALAGDVAFTPDGRFVVFQSNRGGSQSLWRIPAGGGTPEAILHSTGSDAMPAVSPDGRSLAYVASRPRYSLMLTNPRDGTSRVLVDSRYPVVAPEFSPDGTRIAYFSADAGGGAHLYVRGLDDEVPTRVSQAPDTVDAMPRWSADGEWLYHYHAGREEDWRRVNTRDGTIESLVAGWSFNRQHDATVHPDGSRVIYAELEGQRVVATRIKNLATGAELPFFKLLSWPDWSRDGARLLATEFSADPVPVGRVVLCWLVGERADTCDTIADRGQHPVWNTDESAAYFVEPNGSVLRVFKHDVALASNDHVVDLEPTSGLSPFVDVTADGHILWVRHDPGRSELWLLSPFE